MAAGILAAKSADDYVHGGGAKYIQGRLQEAGVEVEEGLRQYPDDARLKALADQLQKMKDQKKKDQGGQDSQGGDQNKDKQDKQDSSGQGKQDGKQDEKDKQDEEKAKEEAKEEARTRRGKGQGRPGRAGPTTQTRGRQGRGLLRPGRRSRQARAR